MCNCFRQHKELTDVAVWQHAECCWHFYVSITDIVFSFIFFVHVCPSVVLFLQYLWCTLVDYLSKVLLLMCFGTKVNSLCVVYGRSKVILKYSIIQFSVSCFLSWSQYFRYTLTD